MNFALRPSFTLGATAIVAIAALGGCAGLAGAPTITPGATQSTPAPRWNAPPPAGTAAWGNIGFDPNQSGFNSLEKTLGTGNVGSLEGLWSSPGYSITGIGGIVESNAAIYISDYSASNGLALQAFDAQTGKLLWTTATPNQSDEAVAVGDGLVFAYTNGNQSVCAFRAKTGASAWCHSFPSSKYRIATPEGLTYANGAVYVPLLGGPYVADALVALKATNGAALWSTNTDDGGCCSLANTTRPVVSKGRVYDECDVLVGSGSNAFTDWGICAYDASSGSELWMYVPVAKTNFSYYLLANSNGGLYLSLLYYNPGTGPDALLQAVSSSGSEIWSHSYNLCHSSQGEFELATNNGTLFAQLDSNGCSSQNPNSALYAFNPATGKQRWKIAEPTGSSTFLDAPDIANRVIYSLDRANGVMAFAASNGETLWNSSEGASSSCYGGCSAQPIVVNGAVYTPCGGFGNTHLCAFALPSEKNAPRKRH